MYFESGIETQSQELGQDLSHPLGAGTSWHVRCLPAETLGQEDMSKGVRKGLNLGVPDMISYSGAQGSPSPGNHLYPLTQNHHSVAVVLQL